MAGTNIIWRENTCKVIMKLCTSFFEGKCHQQFQFENCLYTFIIIFKKGLPSTFCHLIKAHISEKCMIAWFPRTNLPYKRNACKITMIICPCFSNRKGHSQFFEQKMQLAFSVWMMRAYHEDITFSPSSTVKHQIKTNIINNCIYKNYLAQVCGCDDTLVE